MLPHKHVVVSAGVGAVGWLVTGDPIAGVVALAAGVLPDLDHIVDYLVYRRHGEHQLILPLHGYEYALLGAVGTLLTGHKIMGVATLSYFIHLLADQMENQTHSLGYSLLFRAWHRFRLEGISTVPEAAARGRADDMRLLMNVFRR